MSFSQKLNTLMNLFKISNIQLSRGINVDASLISRWKTGERKISKNSIHIINIARYFLAFNASDYQKEYLDRIIAEYSSDGCQLDESRKVNFLADWLVNNRLSKKQLLEKPILDRSPTGLVVVRESQILYVNQAFCKLFDFYDASALIGSSIFNLLDKNFHANILHVFGDLLSEKITQQSFDCVGIKLGGDRFNLLMDIYSINLPDGFAKVIFAEDVSAQKHLEENMRRQLNYQSILLDITESFCSATSDNLDEMIYHALHVISEFDHIDRSYVVQYSDDGKYMSNTHEWCANGIRSEQNSVQNIIVENLPWWDQCMSSLDYLYIPSVDNLPQEAANEKAAFQALATQSMLVVPMRSQDKLIGFVGFDSVKSTRIWTRNSIIMLKTIAQIICKSLIQQKYVLALIDSENYYRTLFNSGEAKMIMTSDFTIVDVNNEFASLLGYSKDALTGSKWASYVSSETANMLRCSSGTTKYITEIVSGQNNILTVLISAACIANTSKIMVTATDLTELIRMNNALEAIIACNNTIIFESDEKKLLEGICKTIVEKGSYEFAWIGFVDHDKQQSMLPVAYSGLAAGYLDKLNISLADPLMNNGPTGKALRGDKVCICRNIQNDLDYGPWKEAAASYGFASSIAIPFKIERFKMKGTMNLYSKSIDAFDDHEVKILTNLVACLAYGIESLRNLTERNNFETELNKSNDCLHNLFMQAVSAFSTVVEIRDPYTSGHQKKVTNLAMSIAIELGLPEDEIRHVLIAAALHDIGKIIVPSEILSKPSKLTPHEYGIIQSHCQSGYDIIKKIDFPWPIAEIVFQHHERIDGSGYPNGMTGEDMHLAAKIIAVADTVDAMASHRPYRASLGIDKALGEIEQHKGSKYDPDVVDACVNLFNKKGYYNKFLDG